MHAKHALKLGQQALSAISFKKGTPHMFSNMIIYRIAQQFEGSLQMLEEALQKTPFQPCGATQEKSAGWVPPRAQEHGALAESVGGQWVMRYVCETKQVPASVLNRKVQEKADAIEKEFGRKPGKKEKRDIKDEVKQDLLPQAFAKVSSMWAWIDPQAKFLVLDTVSQSKADEVVTLLVESLKGFGVALLDTQTSAQAGMAHWLLTQEPPADFSIDRECELKAADESKAVVRYGRHPLDIAEVQQHINQGKLPTKLAMTFDDRVSFVLTASLQIKKIHFLDAVLDDAGDEKGFDTDVAISTGELSKLIPALIEALGGEGRTEVGSAVNQPTLTGSAQAVQDTHPETAPF